MPKVDELEAELAGLRAELESTREEAEWLREEEALANAYVSRLRRQLEQFGAKPVDPPTPGR